MSKNRVEGAFQKLAGQAQDAYGKAADQAQDIAASVSRRVERRPLAAVLIAGAVGYVLGSLTHRRRRV